MSMLCANIFSYRSFKNLGAGLLRIEFLLPSPRVRQVSIIFSNTDASILALWWANSWEISSCRCFKIVWANMREEVASFGDGRNWQGKLPSASDPPSSMSEGVGGSAGGSEWWQIVWGGGGRSWTDRHVHLSDRENLIFFRASFKETQLNDERKSNDPRSSISWSPT